MHIATAQSERAIRRPTAPWFTAWIAAERGRFFLFLPVCVAAGILTFFGLPEQPPFWPPAGLAICLLLVVAIAPAGSPSRAALLATAFAACGFTAASLATARAPPWVPLPRTATIVAGTITELEYLPEGRRITLATPSLDGGPTLPRGVRLRLRDTDQTSLKTGDTVSVRALLRPPSPPAYPGGWDTQRDAWFARMAGYGFAIGPAHLLAAGPPSLWQARREAIAARFRAALPGASGAIAATLFTGLGAAIPPDDRAAFQVSGLAHLLAVAGLHIGIVMGLAFGAVRGALCASEHAALHWPVKRIAALAALAAGLLYLALTGGHVPILRSFAMACLVTLAVLTGRRAVSARALALAALTLMLAAPELVLGVSFQMSFAAVLALVAGWEVLSPRLAQLGAGTWWRTPALYVGGLAATSALAGTASLPYAAYHFGTATLYYVPANMLAVPLTAFWVMPWGLAALALMPFGLETLATAPMGWGIDGLLTIAHAVAAWPGAIRAVPRVPPWGLLLFTAGLAWLCLWRSRPRLAGLPVLLASLASPWLAAAPDIVVSPDARVIALRLGDEALVHLASGASRFDQEIPARVWGITRATAFAPRPDESITCTQGACRLLLRGTQVLLLTDAAAPCSRAGVVLSPLPLRGACPAQVVVDRFSVLDDGATEITLGPAGLLVRTDHDLRGNRPWVIQAATHMATSRLPPAASE